MKNLTIVAVLGVAASLITTPASASLHVTPGNAIASGGGGSSNNFVETAAALFLSTYPGSTITNQAQLQAAELYRLTPPASDDKTLKDSYEGSTSALPGDDTSAFEINYTSGPSIDPTYMLIKDGNHTPSWYLFDISAWDGISELSGSGFWENTNGGISHISIYGTVAAAVPEPATIAVWSILAVAATFAATKRANVA